MDVFSIISTQIKKDLFSHAMKREWNEVVEIYLEHPRIHNAQITKSGDTALHLAVSDGQEKFVEELVDAIFMAEKDRDAEPPARAAPAPNRGNEISDGPPPRPQPALRIKNERGNTPLHLAAALGSVRMCRCIAKKNPELIVIRNQEQKTPLFLAALNGKKDAFLCLDDLSDRDSVYKNSRGSYGDTFLHAALNGEYFDLAFQIICRYGEELVNFYNEEGFTPFHVLATKPSAFRSGTRLGWFDKIIYHCTFVDELKEHKVTRSENVSRYREEEEKEPRLPVPENYQTRYQEEEVKKPRLPENYQTCSNIFALLWNVVRFPLFMRDNHKLHHVDMESVPAQAIGTVPPNYYVWFEAVKFISKAMLTILGIGSREIKRVQDKKQLHVWAVQILNKFLYLSILYEYGDNGQKPQSISLVESTLEAKHNIGLPEHPPEDITDAIQPITATMPATKNSFGPGENNQKNANDIDHEMEIIISGQKWRAVRSNLVHGKKDISNLDMKETPILIAAKNGITEMVETINNLFPVAIYDMNGYGKNIVLLAVENRQPNVFQLLLKWKNTNEDLFRQLDKDGNSALHLAARFGDRRWLIPGLKMQWEIKWYEFIEKSMPISFRTQNNNERQTPDEVFMENHSDLVKEDIRWLMKTSDTCIIAATLIATVAFATSASVPGGVNGTNGEPVLKQEGMFDVFSISSLAALCFSLTALIMFLAILTTQHQTMDFRRKLPVMLLIGLTSLFISIASMLISFCGGHFFILKGVLRDAWIAEYLVALLPMTVFAMVQFPLYFSLFRAAFKKVPEGGYMAAS